MPLQNRSASALTILVPLVSVIAVCAGCSSSPTKAPRVLGSALNIPVIVPGHCPLPKTGNPSRDEFVGIKATANAGLTTKQLGPAITIPNNVTMPCASGADYAAGSPVQVKIFFLKGATVSDQDKSAATLRSSGKFSTVTVQPQP